MSHDLQKTLRFAKFLEDFCNVERKTFLGSRAHPENDAEHSYSLAMFAWYIIERENLDLDLTLVLKYALVHDLVETYAGDTWAFGDTPPQEKKLLERKAFEKIREEFPDFPSLSKHIPGYESRADEESKFVYALDKVHPIVMNILNGGRAWKTHGTTLDTVIAYKKDKIAESPLVQPIFDDLVAYLKENESDLFPPTRS